MQHQKIADIDIFLNRLGVEAINLEHVEFARRKERHQPRDSRLHEMYAGRFERLQKAGCKPKRNHVLDPWHASVTGLEPTRPGISQGRSVKIGEQRRSRLV